MAASVSSIQTTLYLIAVALCIFSTGLTTRGTGRGVPLRFFTWFLVIQSFTFVGELLIAHPATPLKSLWLALLMSSSLLLAPCLWLAFRESIGGVRPVFSDVPRSHWMVIVAGFLCTLPLMSSAHLGTTFGDPQHPSSWLRARFIHATMLICVAIFVVQVPWYLLRCRQILLERLRGERNHWAQLPLAIVSTTWALAILRTLDCAFIKWPPLFSAIVAVISVSVTVGALYALLRKFSIPEAAREPASSEQYAKSPLPAAVRARIRRKLEASFQESAIYKSSDLTLRTLSESLNEIPHYVSQVISQDLNSSFYELVNRYRIGEAQRLLRESPEESVLNIAMSVGFNSKSAFHAAFRRCTGATPGEFRESSPIRQDARAP